MCWLVGSPMMVCVRMLAMTVGTTIGMSGLGVTILIGGDVAVFVFHILQTEHQGQPYSFSLLAGGSTG